MATQEKYALGEVIGSGPTCDVCRAHENGQPNRPLVIRRLREEHMADPAAREAFLKSVDRWSGLKHDRVVEYLDLNRAIGAVVYQWRPFSAASLLRQSAKPAEQVLQDGMGILAALAAMHGNGLLHLNIKPSNLLFDEQHRPCLIDGFCRSRGVPIELPKHTNLAKYQAPETIDPRIGETDACSDVYCLAFVMLEMLSGPSFSELFPWNSDDPAEADPLWRRWHTDSQLPAPAATVHDGITPAVGRFFDKALSKDPIYRFQDAQEALAELQEAVQQKRHDAPAPRPAAEPEPKQQDPTPDAPAEPARQPVQKPAGGAVSRATAAQPEQTNNVPHSVEEIEIGDIPDRPSAPVILRFIGCEAEMKGLSTDYFSLGNQPGCEVKLPKEMEQTKQRQRGGPVQLRFSRGVEGWRVSAPEGFSYFLNQERSTGLSPLRSGDVIRLAPGEPGVQFTIVHQNAAPLSKLVTTFAPRLLGQGDSAGKAVSRPVDKLDDSAVAPQQFSPTTQQQDGSSHAHGSYDPGSSAVRLPKQDTGEWDRVTKALVVVLVALLVTGLAIVAWPTAPEASPGDNAPRASSPAVDPTAVESPESAP